MCYDNLEYAQGRLCGTIIRDGAGEPIYVGSVEDSNDDGSLEIYYNYLKDAKVSGLTFMDFIDLESVNRKFISIKEVCLSSPPLGYCNTMNGPVYVTRRPLRRDWRQGISRNNLTNSRFTFGEIRKTILGEYPPFMEVLNNPNGGAWHRHFAIKDNEIHYRGERVGLKKDSPVLIEGFEWLSEYLKESLEGQFVV